VLITSPADQDARRELLVAVAGLLPCGHLQQFFSGGKLKIPDIFCSRRQWQQGKWSLKISSEVNELTASSKLPVIKMLA
jgi:hypothetical protein